MRALFISDLHLAENRPEANERFIDFIEGEARSADVLYLLGDLFEYWIGDDDLEEPFNAVMCGFLRRLSQSGVRLQVMQGNRDFLLGPRFCAAAGATLLDDPAEAEIGGVRTLLMHGDTLCTDDVDYQAWRKTARSPAWQAGFLGKSLEKRRETILDLREKSRQVIRAKPAQIMDVNEEAVREAMRRHGVRRMVHGHTHRAGHHVFQVAGEDYERWVLPDWYGRGGYLEIAGGKPHLVSF